MGDKLKGKKAAPLCEAFCWRGLGSLVHLERMFTANGLLTNHLYTIMKHIYVDASGLFQVDSSPTTEHEVLMNSLISVEMICYGLLGHQISTQ